MPVCTDLRLGGSYIPESGIIGGTTINGTALAVNDWSGLFGHGGISYTPVEVSGRAGGFPVGDGLPKSRFPTLNMRIRPLADCETGDDGIEGLFNRTDEFLALLARSDGNYLEVDHPDGSKRFIKVYAIDPAPISQPARTRTMTVPLYSPDPYWHQGGSPELVSVMAGSAIANVGGNVNIYDLNINFAADGTLTHNDLDWTLEVSGSPGGTIHVNTGPRTVDIAGDPGDQWLRPSSRLWAWLFPGSNSLTSDVAISLFWRNQYN